MKMYKVKGFTLIELMIAVVVVALLAAIAYPSYTSFIQRSRRGDAKAALLDLKLAQEKFRTSCAQYATGISGTYSCNAATNTYNLVGSNSSPDNFYTLSIVSANATSYSIKATPTGVQTGDDCGVFAMNESGKDFTSGFADAECWSK